MNMNMKVLDSLAQETDKNIFNDIVILHINHCMSNSFYFNNILNGLCYRLFFLVPPYNNRVPPKDAGYISYYAALNGNTYSFLRNNVVFDVKDVDFYNATLNLLNHVFENELITLVKNGKKIIIIEDGGYHYSIIKDLYRKHPELESAILGCVEQTTSGTKNSYKFGQDMGFDYPVLSIARSNLKMRFESIFIARRVVEELNYLLYKLNTFIPFHNIIIVGYGNIGRNISKCLANMYCSIGVYDTDKDVLALAEKEGHKIYKKITEDSFYNNTIMIGNVGRASFNNEMLMGFFESQTNNLILCSSSSKNIEYSYFINIINGNEGLPQNTIFKGENKQDDFTEYFFLYNEMPKTITLLANGMPLNLYREDVDSLTFSVMDIVFTEIFMLIKYIINKNKKLNCELKFLGVDKELEKEINETDIISKWFSLYGYCSNIENCEVSYAFEKHPLEEKLRLMYMF